MKRLSKVVVFIACVLLSINLFSGTAKAAIYTVNTNDTLYKISQLFKYSVNTLKTDNNLSTDKIYPGQSFYVPAEIYSVKSGDTLYTIAQKYGITLTALRTANHKWNNSIYPGQKLALPGIKPSQNSKAVIPYTSDEVNLLARLIRAEAVGEPYAAMVGVGGAVINRVQSPDWPSNLKSVIYQKFGDYYQYTPVKNGTINTDPTELSLHAAWDALYGLDPSNQAIFYYDNSTTNQWILSKPVTAKIGNMIFAK